MELRHLMGLILLVLRDGDGPGVWVLRGVGQLSEGVVGHQLILYSIQTKWIYVDKFNLLINISRELHL